MTDRTNEVLLACTVGNLSWLKKGLYNGVDPYSTDREGFTGLHIAAKNGRFLCLKYLLYQVGIDVNIPSKNHKLTPLHCSLLMKNRNSFQCMKLLLDEKADYTLSDDHGQTVLHYAAKNGMTNCVQLLFESGAEIHKKDNDGMMPYEISCLYNQHKCFRLLSSLHWAHNKDEAQLKKLQNEFLEQRNSEKWEYNKCVTKERASSAYNDWLHAKCFDRYRTIPQECEKRMESRLNSSRISSACTSCSNATSRYQSTLLSSQPKTVIHPIEVSTQQVMKNLDFIGKPKKMLPYTNYIQKSSKVGKGKNVRCSKCTSQTTTGRSSRVSWRSAPSGSATFSIKKIASSAGVVTNSMARIISTKEIEIENYVATYHSASDTDHGKVLSHTDLDDSDDKGGIQKDDLDDVLPIPQYNPNKDESSISLKVGPLNNLDSLSFISSVLNKGRILAEVIQHIRNLEGNKSRKSNGPFCSMSYNSGLYHSRQFNRRTSLGPIPEGKMVHDSRRHSANGDDRIHDRDLVDLKNAVGSIQGESEGRVDDLKLSKEQHKFYTDDELLQLLTEDGGNVCSPDLIKESYSLSESHVSYTDGPVLLPSPGSQGDSKCDTLLNTANLTLDSATSVAHSSVAHFPSVTYQSSTLVVSPPTSAPPFSHYTTPTIRDDMLTSGITTPLSKDTLPSTITTIHLPKDVATAQITPSLIQDLENNITRKSTPPLRKTTPPPRSITPPSRRIISSPTNVTYPSKRITLSLSNVSPPFRRRTFPPRRITPSSKATSSSRKTMSSSRRTPSISVQKNHISIKKDSSNAISPSRRITSPSRRIKPSSSNATSPSTKVRTHLHYNKHIKNCTISSRKMMSPSGNVSPSLTKAILSEQPDTPQSSNISHPL